MYCLIESTSIQRQLEILVTHRTLGILKWNRLGLLAQHNTIPIYKVGLIQRKDMANMWGAD